MAGIQRKPHAIMISLPYQGHLNPFVNLALKLASKGFTITFVHFEFVHQRLAKAHHNKAPDEVDFFSESRELGLDIRYKTISDGFPLEFDRDLNVLEYWESLFRDFPAIADEFVGRIIQSDPFLVHFLVADTCCPGAAAVAKKYDIVNVSFWTEPALVYSLAYHTDLLRENGHFPCKDDLEEEINYIPGVASIHTRDLMPYLKEAESGTIVQRSVYTCFEEVKKKADFVLHNTVHELEPEPLSALNQYQPNYAVGPLNVPTTNAVSKSLWSESDCTNFLESKPPSSVLYVSFGSLVQINKQVIEEIGHGLLLSEVNFIWVVREGMAGFADADVFSAEFKKQIKDQGLVIPWCNQVNVLSNPAVGGFLTHCGWNSVFESMSYGIPMICYPVTYDQPTNRKLVVYDWKCGINLCDGVRVDRKEVAAKIKTLMSGDASRSLRQEANNVKKILHEALETDGSSQRNFNQFIEELKEKLHVTTTSG